MNDKLITENNTENPSEGMASEAVAAYTIDVDHLRSHTVRMLNDISDARVLQRVCQYIIYISDKKKEQETSPLSLLEHKIQQLQRKDYYDDKHLRPSDNVVANTLYFVRQSEDAQKLEGTTPFVRTNGTYLIKWRTENVLATVNIGNEEFTYSVIPIGQDASKAIVGRCSIADTTAVSHFYTLIR